LKASSGGAQVRGVGARFQHMEVERGGRVVGVGHGVEPLVALPPPESVIGVPVAVLMDRAQMQV